MAAITYKIDGVDIREYGIHVSGATGLLSLPERKAGISHSYDDEHGIEVDTGVAFVKERKIKLTCFTDRSSHYLAIGKINNFKRKLMEPGLHRLEVFVSNANALPFDVYLSGGVEVSIKYNGDYQVATATFTLVEPHPVKRVLKVKVMSPNKALTIGFNSGVDKYFAVSWGDGGYEDYYCDGDEALHTYSAVGDYYCLVTGDVLGLTLAIESDEQMAVGELWNGLL